MLHEHTGLGALDISRYIAAACVNAAALRSDVELPRNAFESALRCEVAESLIVTVDDASVILAGKQRRWPRLGIRQIQRTGTAIALLMDAPLLAYAGYHVARTRQQAATEGPPPESAVVASTRELKDLQGKLIDYAQRYQRHRVIDIHLPKDVDRVKESRYLDEVDALFDRYSETAQRIADQLLEDGLAARHSFQHR